MKNTGIFRRIDALGRIVIPKELRKSLSISDDDCLQIFLDGDCIILKKNQQSCSLCGSTEDLTDFQDKKICLSCIAAIKSR